MSQLLAHLAEQFERLDPKDPLHSFRIQAWERFQTFDLHAKQKDAFQYVSLKSCLSAQFAASATCPTDLPPASLLFVDGHYVPERTDLSFGLVPLDGHGTFLHNHLQKTLKEETDPFALLNLAVHPQGAFLYLPPGLSLATPLHCVFLITSAWPQAVFPRLHLVLGKHSQATLHTTVLSQDPLASHFFCPAFDFFLEEGAQLHFLDTTDTLPFGWSFNAVRASVKQHARFTSVHGTHGSKVTRKNYGVQLKGEHAEAELKGLAELSDNRTAHTYVHIAHHAPHTRSQQLFKHVLADCSQSSFEGKIFVHESAQKTEAYQLNHNLILSPGAVANSKPNLEIFADDVKASHGATISQIAPEQLFYLKTRGIDEPQARQLLIRAFCQDILEGWYEKTH